MVYGQELCLFVKVDNKKILKKCKLFIIYLPEKLCGIPPIVSHSEIIQPDRTTNETIQYICQDGYQLYGPSILKCVSSHWQPIPPTCER